MNHAQKAAELFLQGYNCAQAVAVAFCDVTGLEEQAVARMGSGFGGGMGRMREVCGAVSGMVFTFGHLYGYDAPDDDEKKKAVYADVQALAGRFKEYNGSIICRELLDNPPSDPNPTPRSEAFYQDRPCARMVYYAALILEQYLKEHPVEQENG